MTAKPSLKVFFFTFISDINDSFLSRFTSCTEHGFFHKVMKQSFLRMICLLTISREAADGQVVIERTTEVDSIVVVWGKSVKL